MKNLKNRVPAKGRIVTNYRLGYVFRRAIDSLMDGRSVAGGCPNVLFCLEPISTFAAVAHVRAESDGVVVEGAKEGELGAVFERDVEVVGESVAGGDERSASLDD